MRNQTKLAVVLSAAAMLVIGASMTSFAAKGWVEEGGQWFYYNNSGDMVTNDWKKSGADWYWLGDDGAMVTNQLVEDGEHTYYVNANGAMVKDTWVAIEADDSDDDLDVEYRWYYFRTNGKAQKSSTSPVTIHGKKYMFDTEGKMLFGFVSGDTMINDYEDPVLYCDRYFGSNDDGAMYTSWLLYDEGLSDSAYEDLTEAWFWFNGSTGIKITNNPNKKINGKTYAFDGNGVMKSEWYMTTAGTTASVSKYFSAEEDGHLVKKSWVYAVPSEDLNSTDYNEDNYRWFYVDANGALTVDKAKKINGKWYVFDEYGRMKNRINFLNGSTITNVTAWGSRFNQVDFDVDAYYAEAATQEAAGFYPYYFSEDEKNDGSMKTGTLKVEFNDATKTMKFNKSGAAYNGVDNKKLYKYGILQSAGDDKYKAVSDSAGNKYVVGTTGTIMNNGQYGKNADDIYYAVQKVSDTASQYYTIEGDKASTVAAYLAKPGTSIGSAEYNQKFGGDKYADIVATLVGPCKVK